MGFICEFVGIALEYILNMYFLVYNRKIKGKVNMCNMYLGRLWLMVWFPVQTDHAKCP